MAAENLTMTADIQVTPRVIYLANRFGLNWQHLLDIMGVMAPIRKQPGAILKSKTAVVTLEDGNVGEGEQVPNSKAEVKETPYDEMKILKYQKEVSLEAVNDHGYDDSIALTDEEFLVQLQNEVTDPFYKYLNTGTLTAQYDTFQMALAMAKGSVINEFKKMHRTPSEIVGFANIMDVYQYLGAAEIHEQRNFGLEYLRDFMGYRTLFLMSENEVKRGRVIATPTGNIKNYYVDPSHPDFDKAGLRFYTDGVTNLIGFNTRADYDHMTSITSAIMGMKLFAEYLNAIAVVDVKQAGG